MEIFGGKKHAIWKDISCKRKIFCSNHYHRSGRYHIILDIFLINGVYSSLLIRFCVITSYLKQKKYIKIGDLHHANVTPQEYFLEFLLICYTTSFVAD
jgi:hypothetical protein